MSKKIFLGCARGLEQAAVIRTNEAPNDKINHKFIVTYTFRYASKVIQRAVLNPAINGGVDRKNIAAFNFVIII